MAVETTVAIRLVSLIARNCAVQTERAGLPAHLHQVRYTWPITQKEFVDVFTFCMMTVYKMRKRAAKQQKQAGNTRG